MGYSLSWAALKAGDLQTVCSALGLWPTGKQEGVAESKIAGAALPTGWFVVVFNRTELDDEPLRRLSQAGEVVACFVEEHVMFSSAAGWKNGKEIWRVAHNAGDEGVSHLETRGELPAEFEAIRKETFAKQEQEIAGRNEVDYVIEIPIELAKKFTGFQHDLETPGMTGDAFEVLEQATPMRIGKPWYGEYGWGCLSTPIAALLYLLCVALFGKHLPYWATADPKSIVIMALVLHVLIYLLILKRRERKKVASVKQEG